MNDVFHLNLPNVKTFALQRHLVSPWLFCSLHFILAVATAVPDIPPVLCNLQTKGAELGGSGKTNQEP